MPTRWFEHFSAKKQWQGEVKKLRTRYEDWANDNRNGSIGQYLDDRLIVVALSASGGKIEKIQKGMMWLAFYKEFNQQAPTVVTRFLAEHRGSMTRLFDQFNWDKASEYVKNKEWRTDLAGTVAPQTSAPIAEKSGVEVVSIKGTGEEVLIPAATPTILSPEPSKDAKPTEVAIPEIAKSSLSEP